MIGPWVRELSFFCNDDYDELESHTLPMEETPRLFPGVLQRCTNLTSGSEDVRETTTY